MNLVDIPNPLTYEEIRPILERDGVVTVTVARGERAWNPSSTKSLISGPCEVKYKLWHDGGVDATILT